MSQLGAGLGSQYPHTIDTKQTFRNGTVVLPDSDTRVDAEVLNDSLVAIVAIEEALGANVQGAFGSLAARLEALEAGGVGGMPLTNVVAFTNQTTVMLPGAAHQQGQQALFYAVYDANDASTPRNVLAPGSFSMYSTTYNAVVTFGVPQTGVFMVAALVPDYVTTFTTPGTPPYQVTIPGSTHGLAEPYPFVQLYDAGIPMQAIESGSVSVHSTSFDVTLTFGAPQSGTVLLAEGTPRFSQAFAATGSPPSVTIPGSTHGLGSPNLLHAVYAPAGAAVSKIEAGGLSVNPMSFDVVLTFAVPQSGTLVLAPVPSVTPVVFSVQPLARAMAMPALATQRQGQDSRLMAQLQRSVESLTARLTTMETTYQALLAQQRLPAEEPTP